MKVHYKFLISIVFILSVFGTNLSAQGSLTDIAVYANASVYNNPAYDSTALVEFPFTLNRNNFEFYKPDTVDSRYFARIFAHVELLDVSGYPIDSTNTLFTVVAATKEEASKADIRLFNKLSLQVKPGIYSARLTIIDVVSKKKGEFFIDKFTVEASSKTNTINLSSLNSAFHAQYIGIDSANRNIPTYKNGYNLLINPVSVFADSDKSIYVYGEIYNLDYSESSRTKYQLIINALDKDKNIYQMFGSRLSKKPGSSAVFLESIDIAGWNRGTYNLQIIVVDLATEAADTSYLPLSIISPQEVILAAQELKQGADSYSGLTLKQKVQLSTYILTHEQKKTLNNLGDRGKENFLQAIWAEHDETKNNGVNEFREETVERFLYANKNFSNNDLLTNGWNTDRGRIYMQYGLWEQRDDNEAPRSGNSFVVWYYHSHERGLTFVFEDAYGDDEYRLVHSNADGEVYNRQWAEWIITGFMDVLDR